MENSRKINICKKKGAYGVISGAFSLTLSTVIVKLLGVVYKIPLAHMLGEEGMGYFNSAYTVYTFFYLLCTAGVPKAVMILVSEAKTSNKNIDEKRIITVAFTAFLILGTAITACFIVFSAPLAKLIGNSKSAFTMVAIAPSIIFISIAGVIRGYLSAEMKFSSIAVSQIVEGVGKLVLGLVFAVMATEASLALPIISALTILGVTFGALLGLIYLLIVSKFKIIREKARQNNYKPERHSILKRIFSISVPITLSAAVMSITNIIDLMLIMRRLTDLGYTEIDATALYGNYTTLAVPMFNLAVTVITPISVAYLPVFTRAIAADRTEIFNRSVKSSLELSGFVSAPLMIGMMVYSKEILRLIFGDVGTDTGAPLLCLIAPGLFFMSMLLIVNSALEAYGKVKAPVISMLIGSALKSAISYILLGDPSFGISGAPIGTVISYATALVVSLFIAHRYCDFHPPILSSYLLPHINALAAILPTIFINDMLCGAVGERAGILIIIAFTALLYLALSVFTGVFGKKKLAEMSKYTNFA